MNTEQIEKRSIEYAEGMMGIGEWKESWPYGDKVMYNNLRRSFIQGAEFGYSLKQEGAGTWGKADKLVKGCIVYMNGASGLKGYGNPQCVSWVSHEIGELSLFGHNEHYHTYDVKEIIHYPIIKSESSPTKVDIESLKQKYAEHLQVKELDTADAYAVEWTANELSGVTLLGANTIQNTEQ